MKLKTEQDVKEYLPILIPLFYENQVLYDISDHWPESYIKYGLTIEREYMFWQNEKLRMKDYWFVTYGANLGIGNALLDGGASVMLIDREKGTIKKNFRCR